MEKIIRYKRLTKENIEYTKTSDIRGALVALRDEWKELREPYSEFSPRAHETGVARGLGRCVLDLNAIINKLGE